MKITYAGIGIIALHRHRHAKWRPSGWESLPNGKSHIIRRNQPIISEHSARSAKMSAGGVAKKVYEHIIEI